MYNDLEIAKKYLLTDSLTLVAARNGKILLKLTDRGVSGLYHAVIDPDRPLKNSYVADKVVGKGASFLMVTTKIAGLYSNVISRSAAVILKKYNITFTCQNLADNILNRNKTDLCPVERLCLEIEEPQQALSAIAAFLKGGKE
jgi:hypothetical protein